MNGKKKNQAVRIEELTDIPASELESLEESYRLDGAIDIKKVQQDDDLWTLIVTFAV